MDLEAILVILDIVLDVEYDRVIDRGEVVVSMVNRFIDLSIAKSIVYSSNIIILGIEGLDWCA